MNSNFATAYSSAIIKRTTVKIENIKIVHNVILDRVYACFQFDADG